jgi:hypothetical protein
MSGRVKRPGLDFKVPMPQHIVLAMLWMTAMAGDKTEMRALLYAFAALAADLWGWDEHRLQEEMRGCHKTMVESGGRMTFWFTEQGLEFDFSVPKPRDAETSDEQS